MNPLKSYTIPIMGLESGQHEFRFEIGSEFFSIFDNSLIDSGLFTVEVSLDKKVNILTLHFDIKGYMDTPCDRCLESIKLPIENAFDIHLKYSDEYKEEEDIIYITKNTNEINVGNQIYEMISLSVPIAKVYDCDEDESAPCNDDVLEHLNRGSSNEDEDNEDTSIWDVLKDLK